MEGMIVQALVLLLAVAGSYLLAPKPRAENKPKPKRRHGRGA